MKRALLLVLPLFLFAFAGCEQEVPLPHLANAHRAGLECTNIEQLVALEEEQLDLGRAALIIQHELCPELDIDAALEQLDELARGYVGPSIEDVEQEAIYFVDYLYHDHGFVPVADSHQDGSEQLARVLAEGSGNCVGLSLLYLAVAERVGLDLSAVMIPWHVFVSLSVAGESTWIEPTAAWLYEEPAQVEAWFFSDAEAELDVYMRALSKREVLSMMLVEASLGSYGGEQATRAVQLAEFAVECAPHHASAHATLGLALSWNGELEAAAQAWTKAIELNPESGDQLAARGEVLLQLDRREAALMDIEAALEADADHPYYWYLLAELRGAEPELALQALDEALAVRWTQLHPLRRFSIESWLLDRESFELELWRAVAELHVRVADELVAGRSAGEPIDHTEFKRQMACADLARRISAAFGGTPAPRSRLQAAVDGNPQLAEDLRIQRYRTALQRARASSPTPPQVSQDSAR
jgi:regulator of sirC expression with transglutaminase-like and TPR domain